MTKEPLAKDQDKFVLRLPTGMRDRISKSAEANKRSMNAEIVQALEQLFPPEPDIIEVLDKVHSAIASAQTANSFPYRATLIEALDKLSERLSSGIEFDQYSPKTLPPSAVGLDGFMDRLHRWRRVSATGVETSDLQRELDRGLLDMFGRDSVRSALDRFKEGRIDLAFKILRLADVRFAEPDEAIKLIVSRLRDRYSENWGDPDEEYEPWADRDRD
ncbi:Arc family DNA-binding protein [Mesorhizobium ciceri]|uniref:Arc family DNA-binding protein n=1 Tax=Mesorhizobium ciceri TaxID=39645 RepID=UPI00067E89E6|nr:Arc family DNA-binding protein [Mesorhizobium ciceri]